MPLTSWSDKLSVGVVVLDNDHKKLIAMVNNLFDGIQAGKGKEVVGKILDGLIAYTAEHFKREEAFFAQAGYPDAKAHKAQHEDLVKQVLAVQAKFKNGASPTLSLEVMNFLKNWLTTHIQETDQKYGPFLNSKGIK